MLLSVFLDTLRVILAVVYSLLDLLVFISKAFLTQTGPGVRILAALVLASASSWVILLFHGVPRSNLVLLVPPLKQSFVPSQLPLANSNGYFTYFVTYALFYPRHQLSFVTTKVPHTLLPIRFFTNAQNI
jgi:hypothetical protein